ncbi:hypothetical protein [Streptomyces sp. AM 2-1-1]|uniref:hypothetical protein n=1 Tax=Streptomyces sp. AM 2-1-1 TaxID=3028709 RepID=UPI0023B9AA6F|nr:hypothetical protein [Streptomyces sp. AM 2-1-1]WEH41938.1 hypothetical protein PZB77_21925 [Streptomyces sp. AM 2-1-1]
MSACPDDVPDTQDVPTPDDAPVPEGTISDPGSVSGPAAGCPVCLDYDWAEGDAERMGDLSGATDWRVLRRRHQAADHPA